MSDRSASRPKLVAVSVQGEGTLPADHVAALREQQGIVLSVLPDYSTESVAEHALGLLLSVAGRIHLANDRSRRMLPATTSLHGFELCGRTLGIIGCGRIGSRVAELAQAVGMRTIAHDIDPTPVAGVTDVEREGLLDAPELEDLRREGRLLQTGHSAWWSDETLARGAVMWGEHIQAMLDGVPLHVVDKQAILSGRAPAGHPSTG